MLCNGPEAEVSEELCEGGRLVVGVEAAGVGEDPGVAAAEGGLLEADAGVFDAGNDAVGTDADEGDDGGAPTFDFGFEALAAGAKFVVREFIGAASRRSVGRSIDPPPAAPTNWEMGRLFQWSPCCAMAQRRRSPKSCARATG